MMQYKIRNLSKLRDKMPVKLVDMVIKCLNPNPRERPDFKQILFNSSTSWFDEMKKTSYQQLKPKILKEESDYKKLINQLIDIRFSNRLCRIV